MRFHIFAIWLAFLVVPGCAIIPLWVADNQPLPAEQRTRARLGLEDADLSHGVFVGVAMSGGGRRAANVSAAVLLELEGLGLLRHAAAVSSVSGSSLTAACFGLFGPVNGRSDAAMASRWTVDAVKARFVTDVQTHWLVAFESFFTRPIPPGQEALREEMRVLRDASRIPTRYRLEAGDLDAPQVQKIPFEAARHLVRRETGLLDETCAWFRARGLAACETR